MQTSQGGFTVLNAPSGSTGGMYPGLTSSQNTFFNNWGQKTIYDEMALGLQPQNAPKQSGVEQGLDLAKNIKDVSDVAQSTEGSSLLGDIFKSGKNTGDTAKSFGLTNAVDKLGVDIGFGAAKGAPVMGGVGPTNVPQAGSLGLQGTLSQTLGGAGLGYLAGGYLGKLVGGNQTGASIGGAAGGALGAAALGSSITTGLGTALGAIGSVLPGVGTVAGIVAGSLLGSMFGKKTKHPGGEISGNTISETGKINISPTFSGKHVSIGDLSPQVDDFSGFLQGQVKKYGIKPSSDIRINTAFTQDANWQAGARYEPGFQGGQYRLTVYDTKDNPYKAWLYNDTNRKDAYAEATKYIAQLSGQDFNQLQEAKKTATTLPSINVQPNTAESPFNKFLREYREKQNANLA